jgi:hypothetical protein
MVKTGLFQVDLRSLALFRIALGILVLMDLAGRVVNLRAHYTDEGVLPRSLLTHYMSEWKWSLAKLNGSFGFEVVLFALAALACLCLIAGWRTQVMTVLVWVFMVSIQVRNPLVSSAADTLLRMMIFWGMLLPLGAVWSLDARREKRGDWLAMSFVSIASAGLILQIAFMYWFTAALKTGDEWRSDGTALYLATGAGQLTRPFGEFIHQFPDLLIVLTFASLGFEFLIPLLLILPWGRGWLRIAGIVGILGFHGGIALMMDVGIFPWVNTLSMMALLPALVWDSLLPKAMAWLHQRYAWLWQRLPRLDTAVPASGERKPLHSTPLLNLFAAFCLVFVLLYNLTTVTDFTLPRESRTISYGLGLYQRWSMFAPYPPRSTSWYVIRGYTADGRAINLLPAVVTDDFSRLEPFSIYEPDNIPDSYYHDKFWRKYFDAIADDGDAAERRAFAQYTCRKWNDQNEGADYLDRLQFVRLRKATLPDNKQGDTKLFKISELSCSDV